MTAQDGGRGTRGTPGGWRSDADVEELHTSRVAPPPRPGGPPLGRAGTLIAAGVVALLAAGFGMLGGRPEPTPPPPTVAAPPATAMPTEVASAPSPLVTPWTSCATPPTAAPAVSLQVNGRSSPGKVETLPLAAAPAPASPTPPWDRGAPRVLLVPSDVITEVWVEGGACANAWNIGVAGTDDEIDVVANSSLDPGYASQNRFRIQLAPFAGRDVLLRADLFFPGLVARATWPIHVQPFGRPSAELRHGAAEASLVEGCDVTLTLGSGYEDRMPPDCDGDISREPASVLDVDRDGSLEFRLGDWNVMSAVLTCGHLSDTSFVAEPAPGCFIEASPRIDPGAPVTFGQLRPAIPVSTWTLAISACALSPDSLGANRICGTWYANAEVRD